MPVYALSRGLGSGRGGAVPAALGSSGGQHVGTTLLDGGVGMLGARVQFDLAGSAGPRRAPGWGRRLAAGGVALLALARTGNVPLVASVPVALPFSSGEDRAARRARSDGCGPARDAGARRPLR